MKAVHFLLSVFVPLLQSNRLLPQAAVPARRFLGRWFFAVCAMLAISGCTTLQRTAHMYSPNALPAHTFRFADGGESLYYQFDVEPQQKPRALLFFYGGSGCGTWKSVMPGYVKGLGIPAVSMRSTSVLFPTVPWACSQRVATTKNFTLPTILSSG